MYRQIITRINLLFYTALFHIGLTFVVWCAISYRWLLLIYANSNLFAYVINCETIGSIIASMFRIKVRRAQIGRFTCWIEYQSAAANVYALYGSQPDKP